MILRQMTGSACALAILALVVGCATTVEDRIKADPERFEAYPPAVQENIRAGIVEPGYTEEMVRMALGDPHRVRKRVTEEATDEVWIYTTSRPGFSVGVGGARGMGGGSSIGTGVGVHTGGQREEALRVIVRDGKVHAIEDSRRK